MAVPYGALDAARVLALAPLLLALPGYVLLLPLAPRWTHLARAVVGAAVTASALAMGAWGMDALLGVPLAPRSLWALYGAVLALAIVAAAASARSWARLVERPRLDARLLLLAAALAVNAALLYHARLDTLLPIHQDEWWGLDASQAIATQGTAHYVEPRLGLWPLARDPELGFHLFAADLQLLTGASWLALFHYAPLLMGALTVTAAWCCGERESAGSADPASRDRRYDRGGYGPEAALLVALLPTSVRLLGPQFFVPLTMGLFFIPTAFLLFTSAQRPLASLPVLALMVLFVFYSHPQSDAALAILIGTYALLTVRASLWKSVALLALASIPFVLAQVYFAKQLDPDALAEASSPLSIPDFLGTFGVLASLLFLAGTYLTLSHPTRERLAWIVTSGAHLLIITLFVVAGIGQSNLYDRAWMHGMLTMSFTAAFALHWLRLRSAAWLRRSWAPAAALALAAVLLVGTTASAQTARERDYYRVVSDPDAEAFAWIREHVDANGSRALVTPWQGTAFHALTGVRVYATSVFSIGNGVPGGNFSGYNSATTAQRVLNGDVSDQKFVDRFNITLVYNPGGDVKAKNFTHVHPWVWVRNGTELR